jgi:hypothetical protein
MLYLNPPYLMIQGVAVFADHADPLQWYYLPAAPKLTTVPDPVSGSPVPSVSLLLYTGDAGSGGFFECDVNLEVPQATLNAIEGELQAKAQLSDVPHLAPIDAVDGSVKMMILGRESAPPPDPGSGGPGHTPGSAAAAPATPPPGEPAFVLKIEAPSKPSLYGDEQATFSVELDQDGAALMKQALLGQGIAPVGIVYSLDFIALRPAYTVKLNIDWNRVQTQLDQDFHTGVLFLSTDIDKAVDKLIDSRVIDLQVDAFVPDGPDAASVITDKDKAVAEVREMITNTFFTASIDPTHKEPDGWDKAEGVVDHLSALAVTGGLAATASFSYRTVDLTRIDQKTLNVVMSERTAVRRTIWPQGHLSAIVDLVAASGINMSSFIKEVNLDDDFFKRRSVIVKPIGINQAAGILSVDVNLTYGADTRTVQIDPTAPVASTASWASVLDGTGHMTTPVHTNSLISFADQPGLTRPKTVTSPDKIVTNGVLDVFPPDDVPYTLVQVPIRVTDNFPWDRWSEVDVDLHYSDPAKGIDQVANAVLTQSSPQAPTWVMYVVDPDLRTFQARMTYRGAAGRQDFIADWSDVPDEILTVANPFSQHRQVDIWPTFDWTKVSRVFVDMTYTDPPHAINYDQSYEFDQTHQTMQSFVVDLQNPGLRKVAYSVSIVYPDGHQATIPPSFTLDDRLILTAGMKGTEIVSVVTDGGDFTGPSLKQVVVSLRYSDPAGSINVAKDITLTADSPSDYFQFPYTDPANKAFQYSVVWTYTSGLSRTADTVSATGDTVVIPIS